MSFIRKFDRIYSLTRHLANRYSTKSLFIAGLHLIKSNRINFNSVKFTFGSLILSSSMFGLKAKTHTEEEQVFITADKLFDENKFHDLIDYIKSQPSWYDNSEWLWRAARCEYQIYKEDPKSPKNIQNLHNSYLHVQKSLELNNECGFAHKWAAILLDEVSKLEGTKARIQQLLNIKEHMENAIKYSPNDPTSYYLLGEWHYSVYNVSWLERNIASVLFSSLPESNLDIALEKLLKAEEIEPNFYSKNQVLIAKVLFGLKKDEEKAKEYLRNVVKLFGDSNKWDDKEAVTEAKNLLKKYGE